MQTLKSMYAFLTLCTCLTAARGQEILAPSPAEHLTTVPFRLVAESVILVKGRIPGHADSLSFVLDTGSSGISLDSAVVTRMGLSPEPSAVHIRGIAGVREALFLYDRQLQLGDELIDSLDFHVNDYEFLSYVYGEPIDGVIGYALFSRYIVKIDYDNMELQLHTPGTLRYPRGGHLLRPFIRTLPVQSAQIRDSRAITTRYLIDIGAGLPLILSEDFVEDSTVFRGRRKRLPVKAYGVGGQLPMGLTVARSFRIGPYRFRKVPAMVFDDQYNVTSYPYLGGLIGNQILKRFNLIVNYPAREIHLRPNGLYRDPFSYVYSGVELYSIGGYITVGSVVKGSPGDLAGLREGDVVIAVDNDVSQDFAKYKRLLMYGHRRVPMVISRNGALETVTVKLQRIR